MAGIDVTGGIAFGDLRAQLLRDPDRNVIELDEYAGDAPSTRLGGYRDHP